MDPIEKRARELLAAQFDAGGSDKRAKLIREARDHSPVTEYAVSAIIAALTPPEGYRLVPVEMTKELGEALDESIKYRYSAESAWDLAIHAVRPEVP